MALLVWKCVHGIALAYLRDLCIHYLPQPPQVDNNWNSADPTVKFSLSMGRLPGTVCCLHYGHQICHTTLSSKHERHIYSQPPGTIETVSVIPAPGINILTYLLTKLIN